MRDHLEDDIGEIIIDDEDTYENSKKYIKQVSPKNLKKLKHYSYNMIQVNLLKMEKDVLENI